jgi:hypothetical protein
MPTKNLKTLIQQARKKGRSTVRFTVTKEQGEEIKRLEREHGTSAALKKILELLRQAR